MTKIERENIIEAGMRGKVTEAQGDLTSLKLTTTINIQKGRFFGQVFGLPIVHFPSGTRRKEDQKRERR